MAASYEEIAGWFDQGVTKCKSYMIVWCDTYDYENYPGYYDTMDGAQKALDNPSSMQRAMECYDLRADKSEQMNQFRAWALHIRRARH